MDTIKVDFEKIDELNRTINRVWTEVRRIRTHFDSCNIRIKQQSDNFYTELGHLEQSFAKVDRSFFKLNTQLINSMYIYKEAERKNQKSVDELTIIGRAAEKPSGVIEIPKIVVFLDPAVFWKSSYVDVSKVLLDTKKLRRLANNEAWIIKKAFSRGEIHIQRAGLFEKIAEIRSEV